MEDLFTANLTVNNQNILYQVIFDEGKYVFISKSGQPEFASFSFLREHDEWQDQDLLPEEIKEQAVEALEKYLLKQH